MASPLNWAVTLSVPCGSELVIRMAEQVAAVVAVPAVEGVQAIAAPNGVDPLKNCTVLPMATPLLTVEATVAVSLTLEPAVAEVVLEASEVVVACPPPVTVIELAADGPMAL